MLSTETFIYKYRIPEEDKTFIIEKESRCEEVAMEIKNMKEQLLNEIPSDEDRTMVVDVSG
mgnify:CR=1 FL=1